MLNLRTAERVLAALGEASRLRLMLLCATAEQGVGELANALDQSEPRVSRHLKILAEAGLVGRRREGHRVLYRTIQGGVYAGQGRELKFYPMPAPADLDSAHHEWWHSAQASFGS